MLHIICEPRGLNLVASHFKIPNVLRLQSSDNVSVLKNLSTARAITTAAFCILLCHYTNAACRVSSQKSAITYGSERAESKTFSKTPDSSLSLRQQRFESRVQLHRLSIGYYHHYTVLNISEPTAPQSNGHLHEVSTPIWYRDGKRRWQFKIVPALSISSNMLKNPDEIESESWQLRFAAIKSIHSHDKWQWHAGLCGDYRFGDYQIYPLLGMDFRNDKWSIQLTLPDINIKRTWKTNWHAQLSMGPDGKKWFVKNKTLSQSSDIIYKTWFFGVSLNRDFQRWSSELSYKRNVNNHLRLTLQDDTLFDSKIPHFSSVSLNVSAFF